jgi:hypothetical protein
MPLPSGWRLTYSFDIAGDIAGLHNGWDDTAERLASETQDSFFLHARLASGNLTPSPIPTLARRRVMLRLGERFALRLRAEQ